MSQYITPLTTCQMKELGSEINWSKLKYYKGLVYKHVRLNVMFDECSKCCGNCAVTSITLSIFIHSTTAISFMHKDMEHNK